jgi:hypothetical protein
MSSAVLLSRGHVTYRIWEGVLMSVVLSGFVPRLGRVISRVLSCDVFVNDNVRVNISTVAVKINSSEHPVFNLENSPINADLYKHEQIFTCGKVALPRPT